MRRRAAAALVPALLLAGCGSPATRFYALSPVAPAAAAVPAAPCPGPPVTVGHVTLPETLDRQSIVRATGPNRLEISSRDRWAAPLDGMIGRVLAADLRQRLPAGSALAPGDPGPAGGAARLAVNILQFMPDAAGRVVLRADWTMLAPDGAIRLARTEFLTEGGAPGSGPAAAAMSRAVGELADHIAAALIACPA